MQYACRKTLADSRPRVRGRFAKNDELEMNRNACCISNQEEDTDEDVSSNSSSSSSPATHVTLIIYPFLIQITLGLMISESSSVKAQKPKGMLFSLTESPISGLQVVVKDEDDMVDSSDIFAHISGVNSFKCNNPLQSWI